MFPPDFDPLAQLNQCQMDLLRQNKIIQNLIKQNENICDLMMQHTDAFNSLTKKFNQLLREHRQLQVKVALIDTK